MKKKIIFFIHTLGGGGAEKVLLTLLKNMDKSLFDITVMTIVDYGIYVDEVKKIDGVKYRYMFKYFFRDKIQVKHIRFFKKSMDLIWRGYKFFIKHLYTEKISKRLIKEEYDIEVSFLEGLSAKIVSKSFNKKSKKYAWIHTDLLQLTRASAAFKDVEEEKECYQKFNKIFCVSQDVKECFIQKLKIYNDKVTVVLNPIDSKHILDMAKEDIDDIEKPDSPLLCAVGRLSEEKGFERLIHCIHRLLNEEIDCTLWIIGKGPREQSIKKYIADNKLENHIKLLGFKQNPYKYINQCDIFVSSSFVEGLSTVMREAIILKKPVVSTLCSGVAEILGSEDVAGKITDNDEDSLYNGLYEMLTDKDYYLECLNHAKIKSEQFNLEKKIKKIQRMLLGKSKR